jgi:glycosyltransferase involved in cell wall biosynthesis
MRDQMLRRARQLGLEERLILAGVSNQVLSGMSIMDVLLLTSRAEGLPNVLLEAQWAGMPVVTTDVGGAKEATDPGLTGWSVASNRPLDVARRVIGLHRTPGALVEAGQRGPAFVRKHFGVARMISQIMKTYGYEELDNGKFSKDSASSSTDRRRCVRGTVDDLLGSRSAAPKLAS